MNHSEKGYINLCKQLIEEKFHFENDEGNLRQRDLEYLADSIEERSGIKLSLSTLKRVWKKDYDQTPHPSTLQALVSVLGFKDWQEFKLKAEPEHLIATPPKKRVPSLKRWMVLPALLALVVLFWLIAFRTGKLDKTKPLIKGPVTFTGNKTVSQGVPSTIVFNYDLRNVVADSFFFQQAWNNMEKVRIDPQEHYYSNIYYYPGFHKAKLIANDSIIKRFRVHITTNGWQPLVRYSVMDNVPVYIKKNNPIIKGALHVNRNDLTSSGVNVDKDFVLSYFNVHEFENITSDNFSLETKIVCDSSTNHPCPAFELVIICEENIFFVDLTAKGCEHNIGVKMGEVYHNGTNSDLSAFGRDLYKWQRLQVQVARKQATIYVDDKPVHTITFKNDFGKIMGLNYSFTGTGAIDYVKLKNGEGQLVYEDEFDQKAHLF
jgi:hypothetical protein